MAPRPVEESPLLEHFTWACTELRAIETQFVTNRTDPHRIDELLRELDLCLTRVIGEHMFSRGDRIEDIPAEHIKYLLITFYAAQVYDMAVVSAPPGQSLSQDTSGGPQSLIQSEKDEEFRLFVNRHAISLYRDFLLKLKELGITPISEESDDGDDEDCDDPAIGKKPKSLSPKRSARDQFSRREKIIAEAREEARIQAAIDKITKARTKQGGKIGSEYETSEPDIDPEDERELWMLVLKQSLIKASKGIRTLKQEKEILEWSTSHREDARKVTSDVISDEERVPETLSLAKPITVPSSCLDMAAKKGPSYIPLDEWRMMKSDKLMERMAAEKKAARALRGQKIAEILTDPGYRDEEEIGHYAGGDEVRAVQGPKFGLGEMGEWMEREGVLPGLRHADEDEPRIYGDGTLIGDYHVRREETRALATKRPVDEAELLRGGSHVDAPDYDEVGVYKVRKQDEFHDEHPYGSGNRLGMG